MPAEQTKLELTMVPSMKSFLRLRDLPYDPWFAVAELVDNSTQSYLEHKDVLGPKVTVRVIYDTKASTLVVTDDAMGMDATELRRAVIMGERPPNTSGRCEFGMGMKTSCCWLGKKWTIRTKKLGQPFEYTMDVDVDALAESDGTVFAVPRTAPKEKHYTIIEVHELLHKFKGRTLGKMKEFLAEIYRFDIEEGWLELKWNDEKLRYELPTLYKEILPDKTERVWRKDFVISANGKPVSGWVGIMFPGDLGKSGFNCYRRKRLIKPRWKPERVFPEKPGHLLHQRLTGELYVDGFGVTHLKDDFKWENVDPEEFTDALFEEVKEFRDKALKIRRTDRGQTAAAISFASQELKPILDSPALVESLQITERTLSLASTETPQQHAEFIKRLKTVPFAKLSWTIKYKGEYAASLYFPEAASPNDPYVEFDFAPGRKTLDVMVNVNHPFAHQFDDLSQESFQMYIQLLVYEVLAEWVLLKEGKVSPSPEQVRKAKDVLLRTKLIDVNVSQGDSAGTALS